MRGAAEITKLELHMLEALWAHGNAAIREIQEVFPEAAPGATRPSRRTGAPAGREEGRGAERQDQNVNIFEPIVARDVTRHRLLDEILSFSGDARSR